MFSTIQRKPHAERKRMFSNIYSKSVLQSSQVIRDLSREIVIERLLPIIEKAAVQGDVLNVLEYSSAVYMDFISAFIFGLQNSANFLLDSEAREGWLARRKITKGYGFWSMEFPFLTNFLAKIGIHLEPPEINSAWDEIKELCLEMLQRVENSSDFHPKISQKNQRDHIWTKPVVYDQLLSQLTSSDGNILPSALPKSQLRLTVASELMDHILAGTETSSWTLAYLMHELSQRFDLQSSLRKELLSLSPPILYPSLKLTHRSSVPLSSELPSPRSIDGLPLLDAILLETLRLRPSVPGSQPRIIPPSQRRSPISICGYTNVPAGTRVSAQAYSLHRNEEVFPEPEAWRPERWLEATTDGREEMMRWFWAFGSGGRMCIGNNFAVIGTWKKVDSSLVHSSLQWKVHLICQPELKLVVAAIYTNYTTKIIDEEDIEQLDSYSAGPKGDKLVLQFENAH
jgi:cytochrome P450